MKSKLIVLCLSFVSIGCLAQKHVVLSNGVAAFSSPIANNDSIFTDSYDNIQNDFTLIDSLHVVDLGLSVMWADRNVGAESPDLFGDYYAWGETEIKSAYTWGTYQLAGSNEGYDFLKYNTKEKYGYVDSLSVLQTQDDVAFSLSAGKWRIPTKEEWHELITKCKWEDAVENGVVGKRVIASNGNSIFLPAAEHKGAFKFHGGYSEYWSATLSNKHPYQAYVIRDGRLNLDERYKGYPIRPVQCASQMNITSSNATVNFSSAPSEKESNLTEWHNQIQIDGPSMEPLRVVDMGLSVKWADRNVGAERPDLYGNYYAWGEIETKSVYSWTTYQLCGFEAEYDFLKYNTKENYGTVDSLVVLDRQEDVAATFSDGKWRIPTKEEWQELITKCTWKDDVVNGVVGKRVIAPNGNSIFLPAAEHKGASSFDGGMCDYWSSSLSPEYPFHAYMMRNGRIKIDYRYKGYPIRAVCK